MVTVDHETNPRHAVKSFWVLREVWESDERFSDWLGTWFTDSLFFWEVVTADHLVLVEVFL